MNALNDMNLNVLYDLKNAPLSFDFAVYLSIMTVIARGNARKVSITVLADQIRKVYDMEADRATSDDTWRIENMICPMLANASEVSNWRVIYNINEQIGPFHVPADFDLNKRQASESALATPGPITLNHLDQYYQNYKIHPGFLTPNPSASRLFFRDGTDISKPFVTLTLRFSKRNTGRNTRQDQLAGVLQALRKSLDPTVDIIVICDQDAATPSWLGELLKMYGARVSAAGELSLTLRFWLYSKAVFNVSWNTGPVILLYLHSFPYLSFGALTSSSGVANESFLARKGPKFGQQLAWSRGVSQVIEWTDSEILDERRAFEATLRYIASMSL